METKPKALKYDLAERMRSRKFKTLGYDDSRDSKDNDKSYRENIKMRKKKVILEDDEFDTNHKIVAKSTRNKNIVSTSNHFTAVTRNRGTRVIQTGRSRVSSRESEED
jgi:hypothetical protein